MDDRTTFTGWVIAKLAAVWALVGVGSWSELAGFLGSVYTAILILQYLYKELLPWWRNRKAKKNGAETAVD